jgi:hypothetical protein
LDTSQVLASFRAIKTLTLFWSAVSNATSYRYWAINQATKVVYQSNNLTGTSLTLTNLPPGYYDWYLHAVNEAGSSNWTFSDLASLKQKKCTLKSPP